MAKFPDLTINNDWILSKRAKKNPVDPEIPYAFLVEKERNSSGIIEDVATIFLTNRECPFRCLMCDLWKNTTDVTVPRGAIPNQIYNALERLSSASSIKLYNSGNFFDTRAIPEQDYAEIASLLQDFDTIIVESHPKLVNDRCMEFSDMLNGSLEIAIGLETCHPDVLPALNKRMNLNDFTESIEFLNNHGILSRAFILLCPPFLNEEEGVHWAKRSLDFAFEAGVECCVIIPTRTGNGAIDWLEKNDYYSKPSIYALEEVMEYGIQLKTGRVFADLWDIEQFSNCDSCSIERINRLNEMNLQQDIITAVSCSCNA
ncbi:radical SAM protein [Bacteroidota bacterium]